MVAAAWMLDTHVLSDLIRDPRGALASRVIAEAAGAVCTSIIVACALRFGAARKGSPVLLDRVDQLLDRLDVLPLDTDVDRHCADIRAALERAGIPNSGHPLFIAAHARCLQLTLVTRNKPEFVRVPGLRIETWQEAGFGAPFPGESGIEYAFPCDIRALTTAFNR